jgi:hypothetical protein
LIIKGEDRIVEDEVVEEKQENNVIALTDKTFENFIREKSLTLGKIKLKMPKKVQNKT